jgi:cysteine desulfurase/selenocysteine lyase
MSLAMETTSAAFDLSRVRADFPILSTLANGKPLVYLDNGATTQKPLAVVERLERYYQEENANIHRGVYHLSQLATGEYESARATVREFVNAAEPAEIIFTRGTTESINLVAHSFGRAFLKAGDEIIISAMEHHSNIVPWQIVCQMTGAVLRVIPMNDQGELLMEEYARLLSPRTKVVSVVHVSNSLGTINDVKTITRMAHEVGAKVLVDGAQWVAHAPTDVRDINCDFYAFSGHKLLGPTGIGVLYGRRELLEMMPPFQGGGDMIESVTFEKTIYAGLPNKFEAGTPHIAGAVGLAAAIDYLRSQDWQAVMVHERQLLAYATEQMTQVPGLRVVGTASHKASVISFVMESPAISSLDIGMALDREGIAVRTGHHCCQPVMDRFGIPGTARASLALYNTREDVDALVAGLKRIAEREAARKPAASSGAQIEWPKPAGTSPEEVAEELAGDFEMLGERDARNQYVLELGEKLPHPFDILKTITPRIPGCMSEVYLVGRKSPDDGGRLEFIADANADIVRGLIAILERLYSGQQPADILRFDIENFFQRIGLDQFISSQRRNGLGGMIARIRTLANELAK